MAGCLFLGDLMMLLMYFLPIHEGRHNCTIVGSLIHGFFLAAGGWMAMMGHTAFKTITAGKPSTLRLRLCVKLHKYPVILDVTLEIRSSVDSSSTFVYASTPSLALGVIGGKLRAYFFLSWGITISSIGVTYISFLRHLGTDPRCFISWTNEVKGVFFVPQLGFCMAAVFFVCIVFFNLHTSHLR